MSPVCVRRYPQGPRVWLCGQRVHHGATGCVAAAVLAAKGRYSLALVALVAAAHDRHDWRVWFIREALPAIDLTTPDASGRM
jgi:hypothetical protein